MGSSPRTWGTPDARLSAGANLRFIPTYMGNADHLFFVGSPRRVHPHVHGERDELLRDQRHGYGSSPRTWGTRISKFQYQERCWFIPTYMGNASGFEVIEERAAVHPHVHGERSVIVDLRSYDLGSSPRTWGTRFLVGPHHTLDRFIPTYMGNAFSNRNGTQSITVHPHVHGERARTPTDYHHPNGSSPRTWGTRFRIWFPGQRQRFIPTYMGNADSSGYGLQL